MKKLISALAAAALAALCVTAPAEAQLIRKLLPGRDANSGFKSGNDVLRLCTASDNNQMIECLGFIEGVNDTLSGIRLASHQTPCFPTDAPVDQSALQQAFVAFLIAHPERRPEEGAVLVTAAIQEKWCPAGK